MEIFESFFKLPTCASNTSAYLAISVKTNLNSFSHNGLTILYLGNPTQTHLRTSRFSLLYTSDVQALPFFSLLSVQFVIAMLNLYQANVAKGSITAYGNKIVESRCRLCQSDALKHSSNTAVSVVSGASGHDIYLPRPASRQASGSIIHLIEYRSIVNSDIIVTNLVTLSTLRRSQ